MSKHNDECLGCNQHMVVPMGIWKRILNQLAWAGAWGTLAQLEEEGITVPQRPVDDCPRCVSCDRRLASEHSWDCPEVVERKRISDLGLMVTKDNCEK